MRRGGRAVGVGVGVGVSCLLLVGCGAGGDLPELGPYPWHTDIVATTFWVGEIFDPDAADGSQEVSAYDARWLQSYGGCDGVLVPEPRGGGMRFSTEPRLESEGYFPSSMTPRENPFYLDLPFDDVNDPGAFARRGDVVPWASEPAYADRIADPGESLMKNRWVVLHRGGRFCFGQIQDAGPALYDDAEYVFGHRDERPASTRFNGAGLDVSPALNSCLGFADLDGNQDRVDWAFVDDGDVPDGPWTRVVTTSGVTP